MSNLKQVVSKGAGQIQPLAIEEYLSLGGYEGLKKACTMKPIEIIEEVKKATLLGRGGAAYPAGKKWEHLFHIPETPKYIVCNADEGEPGTYKDRLLMSKLPYKLIEGMTIAGFVFGAKAGYIYVRGEYRKIQAVLQEAIMRAKGAGFLGRNILGRGFDYDIHIISGAGAYVCGENSALLNSTEGKVGRPRIKPPHLAEVGLFLQPTLVNNVESLCSIPDIVAEGGENFRNLGRPDSGGTKLICLSGHVNHRAVFEVPLGGITLREMIYNPEMGNGIPGGKRLKFFHLGGQSGPIGSPDLLDTIYSHKELSRAGLSVGSGAVVVMNEDVPIIDYLMGVTEFFLHESCGKCVPCREGNKQIYKILAKLSRPGQAVPSDLTLLRRLVTTMISASFCGLGQSAAVALNTAWKNFKDEFEANVDQSHPDDASAA